MTLIQIDYYINIIVCTICGSTETEGEDAQCVCRSTDDALT